jgi:hypothetical protein
MNEESADTLEQSLNLPQEGGQALTTLRWKRLDRPSLQKSKRPPN